VFDPTIPRIIARGAWTWGREAAMTVIRAVVRDGKILLDAPEDWPEGTEALIEPLPHGVTLGVREEDWPETPEGIARHLALMDTIEPLEFTAEEEAEWQAARKARKEIEKAHFNRQAEELQRGWE
jgi:hypothetical protein